MIPYSKEVFHTVFLQNLPKKIKKSTYIIGSKQKDNFFNDLRHEGTSNDFRPNLDIASQNYNEIITSFSNITTSDDGKTVIMPVRPFNKFFAAYWEAYNNHGEIILSPDDIWIQICLGFSHHVSASPQLLSKKFFDRENQEELNIFYSEEENPIEKGFDWDLIFKGFESALSKNLNHELKNLIADFSTTTPLEKLISQISLKDNLKRYKTYKFYTECGISKVNFLGKLEDWENLLKKTINLKKYDADFWINQLEEVLTEFVNTYKGNVNLKFWNYIFKDLTNEGSNGGTYISGWILAFFPYGTKDNKILTDHYSKLSIDLKLIPNYGTRTPFTLEIFDKTLLNLCILTGFSNVICQEKNKYRPQLTAAIACSNEKGKIQNFDFDKNLKLEKKKNVVFSKKSNIKV